MQWDTPTDSREKKYTSIAGSDTKYSILYTQESFDKKIITLKLLIFNIKWLKTFENMIRVYQVSRRYIMIFMHNNKYLSLTGLLTLLQWTIYNTACIVLHPAKYFDIYGVKWLNKQTKQTGLGNCSMHKWMKGNVWRIKKC